MNLIQNLKINTKLNIFAFFASLLMVVIGAIALVVISNSNSDLS